MVRNRLFRKNILVRDCLETINFSEVAGEDDVERVVASIIRACSRGAIVRGCPSNVFTRFSGGCKYSYKVAIYKRCSRGGMFCPSCCFPFFHKANVAARRDIIVRERTSGRSFTNTYSSLEVKIALVFCLRGTTRCLRRHRGNGVLPNNRPLALSKLTERKGVLFPMRGSGRTMGTRHRLAGGEGRLVTTTEGNSRRTVRDLAVRSVSACSVVSRHVIASSVFSVISSCFVPCKVRYSRCDVVNRVLSFVAFGGVVAKRRVYRLALSYGSVRFSIYVGGGSLLKRPGVKHEFGKVV